MTRLRTIERLIEKWFLILSLILMVLIIFMQIILRWIGRPTVWAEEVARYIMLYQVWVGAAYAVNVDAHIRITALIGKLNGKAKNNLEIAVLTIWLIFSTWLAIEGFILVSKISDMNQVSSALQIPMIIPYASVPLGGILMSWHIVQKISDVLSQRKGKELV